MYSEKNNNYAANHITSQTGTPLKALNYGYWLQVYLIAVIVCNFILLFWDSNGSDTGFWEDWVKQLVNKGYGDFNGNYPPMYIHWLYVVAKVYTHLNIPVENNIFLKYLTQIPIVISHLSLTALVFFIVKKYKSTPEHFHAALVLTALNPAILFNGAIWGQIDVVPVIPVVLALIAGTSNSYKIYTFPLYCLGLLTKFQMIAFAPVFGILFFTDYKTHLKASILCLAVFLIAFLPYVVTYNFIPSFKLAYVDVLKQYGTTTMGAANIWILLTGNAAPDSIVLFGMSNNPVMAKIFTAKHFGMISFSCVCLGIFTQGLINLRAKKYAANNTLLAQDILFYAVLCSTAFFTLLPAMHERYLLPAVVSSLVCFAISPRKIIYPLAFSFISAFNLAMCMGIKTSNGVWPLISWLMLAVLAYGIMELFYRRSWEIFIKDLTSTLFGFKYTYIIFFIIANYILCNYLIETTRIHKITLVENQIVLTQMTPFSSHQDYGHLNINKSANGTVLAIAGRRFADGLGTHANSQIDYLIPHNAQEFSFIVGLDDETESASVIFSIWGDDKPLWESKPYYGAEKNLETIKLPVENVKKLSLRVSGMGDISSDHADWIQPILTLRKD
ncbi:hypothetical protein GCM10011613_17800 [Cellvibrio zantedeschiae]|uniref:Glycosyl hydrolase family 98 putative carbohydrate-binding module domain-containing protein n=1 Tax=Cellvibrio zantedeschiae TaxID=1237077 RepID=A0ABQ3AZY2_9GAMM|nr:NPCBM/NEW2 domain-containing protein [Cellvibrio zantedeschiae]GGY73173.1 hypothetical protein GCM10011613_17800 [Cellvibrio zantedeschiae]